MTDPASPVFFNVWQPSTPDKRRVELTIHLIILYYRIQVWNVNYIQSACTKFIFSIFLGKPGPLLRAHLAGLQEPERNRVNTEA